MSICECRANNCVTNCTLHLARRSFKAVSKLCSRGDLCISLLCNPAAHTNICSWILGFISLLHFQVSACISGRRPYILPVCSNGVTFAWIYPMFDCVPTIDLMWDHIMRQKIEGCFFFWEENACLMGKLLHVRRHSEQTLP